MSKIFLPILKLLKDKKEHTIVDVTDKIAEQLELTSSERKMLTPIARRPKFDVTVRWAVSHLRHAGLLENTELGKFKITREGLKTLDDRPDKINETFLQTIPKYKKWRSRSKKINEIRKTKATPLNEKRGIVAIIDVLGMKGSWKKASPENIQKKWNKLCNVVKEFLNNDDELKNKHTLNTFSDTMFITIEHSKEKLVNFSEMIWPAIVDSIKDDIPIRGCVSYGQFSRGENLLIGKAVDEAAQYYHLPQWIGISTAPSANIIISKMIKNEHDPLNQFFTKQMLPLKNSIERDAWVINWPSQYDEYGVEDNNNLDKIIQKMDAKLEDITDLDVALKWRNTREFCNNIRKEIQGRKY